MKPCPIVFKYLKYSRCLSEILENMKAAPTNYKNTQKIYFRKKSMSETKPPKSPICFDLSFSSFCCCSFAFPGVY
jgi:hypothetical protein